MKKLMRYKHQGSILPPVRAWKTFDAAVDFAKRTGRKIIIRVDIPDPMLLFGHKNLAAYTNKPIYLDELML